MTLSQVLSYNTEHLVDAAAHWQGLADQREEVFAGVRNDALTLPWKVRLPTRCISGPAPTTTPRWAAPGIFAKRR
jgi:hypothetical protein